MRKSIRQAIPYLEAEGERWIKDLGCVSCHQVPFMVWSLAAAGSHGFDIEEKKLRQCQQWATNVTNFVKPEQKATVVHSDAMAANIDTMSALMLAIDSTRDAEA